jgi:hypothetical protein
MTNLEIALQKLIDEDGFDETKKSLGLTTMELIQKSNCRIDFTMANDILSYLFREKLFPINDGIPVDTELYEAVDSEGNPILLSDGDLDDSESYTFIKWDEEFDNLASYSMWIRRFYLPQVYYVIQKHLDNYRYQVENQG